MAAKDKTQGELVPAEAVAADNAAFLASLGEGFLALDANVNIDESILAEGAGVGVLSEADIKIPVVQILQAQSQVLLSNKAARAGMFYNTATEELSEMLAISILLPTKTRTRFPEKFARTSKPLCRSFDSKTGKGEPGGVCETCQYAQWADDGSNTRPECSQAITLLVADLKNNMSPFRLSNSGMAIKQFKTFFSSFVFNPNFKIAEGKFKGNSIPLFSVVIKVTTEQESNDQGVYYVPKYEIIGKLSAAQTDAAHGLLKTLSDMFKTAVMEGNADNAREAHYNSNTGYSAADIDVDAVTQQPGEKF